MRLEELRLLARRISQAKPIQVHYSEHRNVTVADEPLTSGLADIRDVMPPRIPHVMVPAFPFAKFVKYSD
jgi:hypothetical protein